MERFLGTVQGSFSDVIQIDFGGFSSTACFGNKRRFDDQKKANVSPHFQL
jgi:hypothetical protein